MLTVEDMLTSSGRYPDRPIKWPPTEDVLANAEVLLERLNKVLTIFGHARPLTSGYRPKEINAIIKNAAGNSLHCICAAADVSDVPNDFGAWCLKHITVLERVGLWLEHPDADDEPRVYLQIFPPKSGRRVFYP